MRKKKTPYIHNKHSERYFECKRHYETYGARWDIELPFKELKNKYALDVLETKNVQVIEALLWTAMLTLIVSRRLYTFVRNSSYPEKMVRLTQLRWSTIFAENASDLLTVILKDCGIERTFETLMSEYDSQALDSYVNRERFREEWFEYVKTKKS